MSWQTYISVHTTSPPSCMKGVVNTSSPSVVEVIVVVLLMLSERTSGFANAGWLTREKTLAREYT